MRSRGWGADMGLQTSVVPSELGCLLAFRLWYCPASAVPYHGHLTVFASVRPNNFCLRWNGAAILEHDGYGNNFFFRWQRFQALGVERRIIAEHSVGIHPLAFGGNNIVTFWQHNIIPTGVIKDGEMNGRPSAFTLLAGFDIYPRISSWPENLPMLTRWPTSCFGISEKCVYWV